MGSQVTQILGFQTKKIFGDPPTQTWKKFLAFWASEFGNQNPSADFLRIISYTEGILKICNHYSIIQKELLLPAAEILL
jgi:hypothetical protein